MDLRKQGSEVCGRSQRKLREGKNYVVTNSLSQGDMSSL